MLFGKQITAPDGCRGFDCNAVITPKAAKALWLGGYRFAVRYVRRTDAHSFDFTENEGKNILAAGLGIMLVQHVAPDKWTPSGAKGSEYGLTAALEAANSGYPIGNILWCDLEGVARDKHDKVTVPAAEVIAFCNSWYNQVSMHGYEPGLYVGYAAGLNGQQLYNLRFKRYWSAYNLNADSFPAVRGVQMKQGAYPGRSAVPGVPFQYDTDVCHADLKGDRVKMLVDNEWSP